MASALHMRLYLLLQKTTAQGDMHTFTNDKRICLINLSDGKQSLGFLETNPTPELSHDLQLIPQKCILQLLENHPDGLKLLENVVSCMPQTISLLQLHHGFASRRGPPLNLHSLFTNSNVSSNISDRLISSCFSSTIHCYYQLLTLLTHYKPILARICPSGLCERVVGISGFPPPASHRTDPGWLTIH